jgi:hypothetical protein
LRPGGDGELTVRYGDKTWTLKANAGQPIQINPELKLMQ